MNHAYFFAPHYTSTLLFDAHSSVDAFQHACQRLHAVHVGPHMATDSADAKGRAIRNGNTATTDLSPSISIVILARLRLLRRYRSSPHTTRIFTYHLLDFFKRSSFSISSSSLLEAGNPSRVPHLGLLKAPKFISQAIYPRAASVLFLNG